MRYIRFTHTLWLWFFIISGIGYALPLLAQEDSPPLEIKSVSYDNNAGMLRIELIFQDQTNIARLSLKIIDPQTSIEVFGGENIPSTVISLSTRTLIEGNTYVVEVSALDENRALIGTARQDFVYQTRLTTAAVVSILSVQPQDGRFLLELNITPTMQVSRYEIWLERSDNKQQLPRSTNTYATLSNTLEFPLNDIPAGTYDIVIRAYDLNNRALPPTRFDNIAYKVDSTSDKDEDFTLPPLFQTLWDYLWLILIAVGIGVGLFIYVFQVIRLTPRGLGKNSIGGPRAVTTKAGKRRRQKRIQAQATLIVIKVAERDAHLIDRPFRIESTPFCIGRGDCDLPFESPNISRDHAIITYQKGIFYITDNHSKSGIYLNGGQRIIVGKPIPLPFGSQIALNDKTVLILQGISTLEYHKNKR